MDGFSAFVCSAQALQYVLSVVRSLSELRNAMKHGGGYLRDEQAGVIHLQEIIIQLIPKDKTRLDVGFESHLASISTAVTRLLRLLQQTKRLQIAVLLVIRRAEVHDSFALLERKKTTLNLYLTAQNTAAITAFTTSASFGKTPPVIMSPHSHSPSEDSTYDSQPSSLVQSDHGGPQPGEIPSHQGYLHRQRSESGIGPMRLDQEQSSQQQHESSGTPDRRYHGNAASLHARQDIYNLPFGKAVKISHENNTSDDYALQKIGQSSSGRKSTSLFKSAVARMVGTFTTKENKARNGAEQILYAPDHPGMNTTYDGNASSSGAVQNLGMDIDMDLSGHKFKKHGRFKK
ncbi:MAG: hypothetical protein M1812_006932 [Candelaria pacifica]|nr:MAG: hypothetical protein M1812_006932 [Candelaria pacifica]